jgi:hypothetical protein
MQSLDSVSYTTALLVRMPALLNILENLHVAGESSLSIFHFLIGDQDERISEIRGNLSRGQVKKNTTHAYKFYDLSKRFFAYERDLPSE